MDTTLIVAIAGVVLGAIALYRTEKRWNQDKKDKEKERQQDKEDRERERKENESPFGRNVAV